MRDSRRSPAAEFNQGTTDRTYIQLAPDRGGLVEMDWPLARATAYQWPTYQNADVRGPGAFEQARRHVMSTRIAEPVSSAPVQRRWSI